MMIASMGGLTVFWDAPKHIVDDLALIPLKILPSELSMDRILLL
jgi:hypothetical protein